MVVSDIEPPPFLASVSHGGPKSALHKLGFVRQKLRCHIGVILFSYAGRSSRRQENFACVRIFYCRSGRKAGDVDVTLIWRERTGN